MYAQKLDSPSRSILTTALALAVGLGLTGCGGSNRDCIGAKCDDPGAGQCELPGIAIAPVFAGAAIEYPVALKQPPADGDDRFIVAQKDGTIWALEGETQSEFLRLEGCSTKSDTDGCVYRQDSGELGWEEGLLDIAFHPNYPATPFVYVTYVSGRGADMIWNLSRFETADGGATIERRSELVLIQATKPEDTHNGGSLAFGPDGLLYISVGDGGGVLSDQPQNTSTIFGSVLRLDVDAECERGYGVPADNPFVAQEREAGADPCDLAGTEDGLPEIYAWGIRNPWRMSFDSEGRLWEAEVGQDAREEVNLVVKGKNYGYPMFEADKPTPKNVDKTCQVGCDDLQAPEIVIYHEGQSDTPLGAPVGNSVTGGYVYQGEELPEELAGRYFYADFMTTEVWAYSPDTGRSAFLGRTGQAIAAFGEDKSGELYILHHAQSGAIYRLIEGPCQALNRPDGFYDFLSRDGVGTEDESYAYYEAIIPGYERPASSAEETYTLDQWQDEFFGVRVEECIGASEEAGTCVAGGSEVPDACCRIHKSYFRNAMDLGFWREMYCTESIDRGEGGCMVRNWESEDDLAIDTDLGTVAMNVSPEGYTRFYAFAPGGNLSPKAVLDSEGEKFIPNLCTPCHEGRRAIASPNPETGKLEILNPDLGSVFREFEPSVFEKREGLIEDEFPSISEGQYETELWHLNQAALSANESLRSEQEGSPPDFNKWRRQVIDYIENRLYVAEPTAQNPDIEPLARDIRDPEHMPASWRQQASESDDLAAAKDSLWTEVVHPYCMGCHRANTKDFGEYANFVGLAATNGVASLLEAYTTGEPGDEDRTLAFMPQSELMYDNYQSDLRADEAVQAWLQQVKNPNGPVCRIDFTIRAPTQPGQSVHMVGDVGVLGTWEAQNGLRLSFDSFDGASGLSTWVGSVDLLRGTDVEFKATMVRPRDGGPMEVIWEDQTNRVVEVPDTGGASCQHDVDYTFNDFSEQAF